MLDFTRILSGPYCTLLLSDLGADVVKVEHPNGDDTRWWGPPFLEEGVSTYFASLNRGKRSVTLDLRDAGDRETARGLALASDVVVENFRPGVLGRLGLDPSELIEDKPSLVVASITGFGAAGPYAGLAGTEIIVEGMSGLMSVTGPSDGDPVRFGIALIDIATGLLTATRIVATVMQARLTGVGGRVECSLYGSALAALGTLITHYTATAETPRRWGSHHPTIVPYGGFCASDGHLITGVINDQQWPAFCAAIEYPELADRPEFASNALRVRHRAEVEELIAAQCATRPVAHWLSRLHDAGLLAAPVRDVGEAVEEARRDMPGLLVGLAGHPGIVSPRLDGIAGSTDEQHVARLGEHTREVIAELLDPSLIASKGSHEQH